MEKNKIEHGTKFGKLTVQERIKRERGTYYVCLCDCGNIKSVRKDDLLNDGTRSCGCNKTKALKEFRKLKYPINENFFFTPSRERSYWLGFFLADGYIAKDDTIGIQIKESDLDIMVKLNNCIFPTNRLKYIIKSKKDSANRQNQYRLSFINPTIVAYFKNLGFDNNKSISANIPEEFRFDCDFWRGVIDGNGSIYINKEGILGLSLIGTENVCYNFMNFVKLYSDTKANLFKPKDKYLIPIYTFSVTNKKALPVLRELYKDNPTIFLDRKEKTYKEYLNRITND